jgi:hypothetical protein
MHILRIALVLAAVFALSGFPSSSVSAQNQPARMPADTHTMPMPRGMTAKSTMTRDQKIANAMSAAPTTVSAKATILDWPEKEGEKLPVLRTGTNGWTCFPDMPDTEGNDPMCVDAMWMKWVDAYMSKMPPSISSVGIGYMVAPGGSHGSNSDPYARKATSDNQWAHHPPHIMILVPDLKSLEGLSTDPNNGGPYVMYKDTPYAHIMTPTVAAHK